MTISCATEGATISYSIDGGTTWTDGSTVTVDKTMTIQAKANKAGMLESEVAQATYNLPGTVATLADVNNLNDNDKFIFTGNVVVTFAKSYQTGSGSNTTTHTLVGLRDVSQNNAQGKGGGVFFDTASDLTAGVVLAPNWYAQANDYEGWMQIKNSKYVTTNGSATVEPFNRTNGEIAPSEYIKLNYVTIANGTVTVNNGKKASYPLFNRFGLEYEDGDYLSLIGVASNYDNEISIYPLELEELPQVATPTITPNGGEFTAAQDVTFSCATEGATILYSLDGVNWTAATTLTVDRSGKVYAKATKANMQDSEVAVATFTIN